MNLSGLVSVTGKPGLFKLLAQNKTGFILESLDVQKTKLIVNLSTSKLATLEDITVYGNTDDIKLSEIFTNIKNFKGTIPLPKEDSKILKNFFKDIAPDFDEEKVYASDMKKIVSWYHIIKELPLFNEEKSSTTNNETQESVVIDTASEVKTNTKTKKPSKEAKAANPKTKSSSSTKKGTSKNP